MDDPLAATLESPRREIAGRYEILGILGAGGMGTVYKVRDRELDEVVALKTLRRERVDAPGALDRFRREVKLARRVTHRNVARTFDIGEHKSSSDGPGEKYLTMEYIDGRSLATILDAREPLGLGEALRIALGIAEALEAAHAEGIVHRDLKPDNVMLAGDGRVVVTDFGIARLHHGDAGVTQAGQAIGTPAYMAPEQVEGREVGAAADLYALGLVLYEMLTGERAFSGDSPFAVAAARLTRPPPDLSAVRPDLAPDLAALVRSLLARLPENRPSSTTDVVRALGATRTSASTADSVGLARAPIVPSTAAMSLAVFPLRVVGPPEDAWIAEGLSDDLLDALCMSRGLRVKARSIPFAGQEDARGFGQRLGVELVVDGSTRRQGDEVRIVLRLTSVADGYQAWATRIDCRIGDLLVVSERAAREIANAAGKTSTPSPAGTLAADPEAIELLLRSRDAAAFEEGKESDPLVALTRARELAPDHPAILAAYARVHLAAMFRAGSGGLPLLAKAKAATERAIALAPGLPEPWIALARVRHHTSDSPGAMRALKRAVDAGPSVADAYDLLGRMLMDAKELGSARMMIDRAVWLDPTLLFARAELVRFAAFAGDHEGVERELASLATDIPHYHRLIAPRYSLWIGRQVTPAPIVRNDAFENVLSGTMWRIAPHRGQGLTQQDRDGLLRAIDQFPGGGRPRRFYHQLATEILAYAGEKDAALAAFEEGVAAGLEDLAWTDLAPVIADLRSAPGFAAARATVAERAAAIRDAWLERSPRSQ